MSPTIVLILTVLGGALTLLTVYGALKSDRKLFLSGFFFYSLLPFVGESIGYNADKAPIHVMVIFIFLAQLVLTIPNKIDYGQDNTAATKLATKNGFVMIIFNIAGAVYIFCLNAGVPVQFGYYHIVFALAVVYLIIRRFSSKGASWSK